MKIVTDKINKTLIREQKNFIENIFTSGFEGMKFNFWSIKLGLFDFRILDTAFGVVSFCLRVENSFVKTGFANGIIFSLSHVWNFERQQFLISKINTSVLFWNEWVGEKFKKRLFQRFRLFCTSFTVKWDSHYPIYSMWIILLKVIRYPLVSLLRCPKTGFLMYPKERL